MSPIPNPFSNLVQATDAATKILSLQAELFVLNQELRTMRQIKRVIWAGIGLLLLSFLISFTLYWLQVALHENGWSAEILALSSFLFFGILAGISIYTAIRVGQEPQEKQVPYEVSTTH